MSLREQSIRIRRAEARRNAARLLTAPLGSAIKVHLDNGTMAARTLTVRPWQLGSGDWVCGVSEIRGGYCCARVTLPK